MNLVNVSNRHSLPIYLVAKLYADTTHTVKFFINNDTVYNHTFNPGIEHTLKLDKIHNFLHSGVKKFTINWTGEAECKKKYLRFHRLIVNEQSIDSFRSLYTPNKIKYFDSISDEQLNKKIKYHGHEYGWFGRIDFTFLLADRDEKRNSIGEYKNFRMLEINIPEVFVNTDNKFIHGKVKKNANQ